MLGLKENDRFVNWLRGNVDAVRGGKASYEGFPVTEDTDLTQYCVVWSCLYACVEQPSRVYVVGHDAGLGPASRYSLVSLLLGWWAFPHGPFYTVASVLRNLSGGHRTTVRELIDDITGHERQVVTLTERAVQHARAEITARGFPRDTALRVSSADPFRDEYRVEYDLPTSDGTLWQTTIQGITVLVDKGSTRELEGLVIDCEEGKYTFHKTKQ